jgi:hypothetical protein
LNAEALTADILEQMQKLEKSKWVEKWKGYFDKMAAADRARKDEGQ